MLILSRGSYEPTTWDAGRIGAAWNNPTIVLSNSNMTLQSSRSAAPWHMAVSTTARARGKWYVEATVVYSMALNRFGFGDENFLSDLSQGIGPTTGSFGLFMAANGLTVTPNGPASGTYIVPGFYIAAPFVFGVAFNHDMGLFWFRDVTHGGAWRGNLPGIHDPESSTGGSNAQIGSRIWLTGGSGFNSPLILEPGPTGLGMPPAGYRWWDWR